MEKDSRPLSALDPFRIAVPGSRSWAPGHCGRYSLLIVSMVLAFTLTLLGGCAKTDNASFVEQVAFSINTQRESADVFYAGSASIFDLESRPHSKAYFSLTNFSAKNDEDDPTIVHYSCKIPGVVTASFNAACDTCFVDLPRYSPWVKVEGDLRIVTDEQGNRQIDISKCDNAFAAFAAFRYPSADVFALNGVDVSLGYLAAGQSEVASVLEGLGALVYANITGVTVNEYVENVVKPEHMSLHGHGDELAANQNNTGYPARDYREELGYLLHEVLGYLPTIAGVSGTIAAVLLLTKHGRLRLKATTHKNPDIRREAVSRLSTDKDHDIIARIALEDDSAYVRREAIDKLEYSEDREIIRRVAREDSVLINREKAVRKLRYPEDRDLLVDIVLHGDENAPVSDAFYKLSYPEDRDTYIQVIRTDESYPYMRRHALGLLASSPEDEDEHEALVYALEHDNSSHCRKVALEKLTYPLDRDVLRKSVRKDEDASIRLLALDMLSKAADQDVIGKAATDEDTAVRLRAVELLSERGAKSILIRVARSDKEGDIRGLALGKLSYDKGSAAVLRRAALDDDAPENRITAISKLSYPEERDTLRKIASSDENMDVRRAAMSRMPYVDSYDDFVNRAVACYTSSELSEEEITECEKAAIVLTLWPQRSTEELQRMLCRNIQRGLQEEGGSKAYLTLAGWSTAALGRMLALSFDPDDMKANYKALEPAIDRHNKLVERVQDLYRQYEELEGMPLTIANPRRRELSTKIKSIHGELSYGIGSFMLDNGNEPLSYLLHILNDNQSRIPRFVRQGVIMGLLDWLVANSSHPEAREALQALVRERADIITSDNELSFFEVRVPKDCIRNDYAEILEFVLHCSNPSIAFADTDELLDVAQREVPGVMDMLCACPLRLIDPANQENLGFYTFKPYIHAMWVQYRPPLNEGEVISRYHEIDDRTRPLSSGLNLRLFTDPYSVIPTMFHEHEHYAGDSNEASVFLKTQVFSIGFYKRHREAKVVGDAVFARLADLLGMPPASERCNALNELIERYYGTQIPQEEAEEQADDELARLNLAINISNARESWQPSVRFPLFTDDEDARNRDLIRDVLIRHATVAKSLTQEEYDAIIGQ